jgi:hypothetical protein
MRNLTGKEWLLVAIGLDRPSTGSQDLDRVRLMKTLFVFGKLVPAAIDQPYQFEPYNYGPFDVRVYQDAEGLVASGLVEIKPGRYPSYTPTEKGSELARQLIAQAPSPAVEYMKRVRAWSLSVDFSTLVKAIYQQWPEMRARSQFQG